MPRLPRYQGLSFLIESIAKHGQADACLLWPYSTNGRYGIVCIEGRNVYAHRVAFELNHGPISNGLQVCHRCDTPLCYNPPHLFTGTQSENVLDCVKKGRANKPYGEKKIQAKMTDGRVKEMRDLYATGIYTQRELGRMFGISDRNASAIVMGYAWKHVPLTDSQALTDDAIAVKKAKAAEKQSRTNTGIKRSPETLLRMSEAAKAFRLRQRTSAA